MTTTEQLRAPLQKWVTANCHISTCAYEETKYNTILVNDCNCGLEDARAALALPVEPSPDVLAAADALAEVAMQAQNEIHETRCKAADGIDILCLRLTHRIDAYRAARNQAPSGAGMLVEGKGGTT